MSYFRNQDEDLNSILEHGNYYGAGKGRDEKAATADSDLVSLQIILIGMFACFILSQVISDLILVAALGSFMIWLGAFRLRKESRLVRGIMLCSIFQTLWRIAVVVFSYFPNVWGGMVLTVIGFGFSALGLVQIAMLCLMFRRTSWVATQSKIPGALIGYILLFVLSFFALDIMFVVRAVIGALVGLYLRDVYNYSDIKNT